MIDFRLVSFVLVFLVTVSWQEDRVTNTNLDIVFLLDQERTNLTWTVNYACNEFPFRCSLTYDYFDNSSNYKMAYDGVKNWMQSFFDMDGSSDARFAVILSCNNISGGPVHDFMDRDFANKVPKLLEQGKNGIKKECRKNLKWMMNLANKRVFTTDHGHRADSSSIAIVLSDCVYEQLPPSEVHKTESEFNYFFRTIKGQIFFVCYVEFKGRVRDYFKAEIKQFMNEMLVILRTNNQPNRSMIYLDGHNVNVGQRLDQLLPKRSRVSSTNCNQTWDCGICSGNGACFTHCNWTTHTWPTGNGTNCTEQAPMIKRCTCPSTTHLPTEPPSYLPIILGFGILLVVLVGVVIAVCCIRAKNTHKKRTKNKAVAVQTAPQKKVDIAVDLSREQSTTNTMGQASRDKSVSMMGSVVKSMSKRGSVVKSFVKTGSMSKPADERGKSVSKPKGKGSKSKALKCVTGKNVKSIQISKKSVTSKSFAAKSRMKSKRKAAN